MLVTLDCEIEADSLEELKVKALAEAEEAWTRAVRWQANSEVRTVSPPLYATMTPQTGAIWAEQLRCVLESPLARLIGRHG